MIIIYQETGNSMKHSSTFEGKIGVNGIGKFGLITDMGAFVSAPYQK